MKKMTTIKRTEKDINIKSIIIKKAKVKCIKSLQSHLLFRFNLKFNHQTLNKICLSKRFIKTNFDQLLVISKALLSNLMKNSLARCLHYLFASIKVELKKNESKRMFFIQQMVIPSHPHIFCCFSCDTSTNLKSF